MTISVISSILLYNYDTIEVNDFIELAINSMDIFLHNQLIDWLAWLLLSIETAAIIFLTGNRPYGPLGT